MRVHFFAVLFAASAFLVSSAPLPDPANRLSYHAEQLGIHQASARWHGAEASAQLRHANTQAGLIDSAHQRSVRESSHGICQRIVR
ncbi:hypothetical protein PIIN_05875 [Serendipita indica DSM 11827]|uniref:SCP domain-containing protein n=1 Tax=Serendipita indica (strain DSM 11827) TaxID=1109443 RepID=G4TKU7_SERID|nr:hypothetical protein PIIN_05875 [Serendipita indica DSM 11827]